MMKCIRPKFYRKVCTIEKATHMICNCTMVSFDWSILVGSTGTCWPGRRHGQSKCSGTGQSLQQPKEPKMVQREPVEKKQAPIGARVRCVCATCAANSALQLESAVHRLRVCGALQRQDHSERTLTFEEFTAAVLGKLWLTQGRNT